MKKAPKSILFQKPNILRIKIKTLHGDILKPSHYTPDKIFAGAKIFSDKIENIKQTGAKCLLGGDCGCLLNISGAMKYSGIQTDHQHIAEFIWHRISENNT